jgi:hypothetical protein
MKSNKKNIKKTIHENYKSQTHINEFSFSDVLPSRVPIENYNEDKIKEMIKNEDKLPQLIQAIKSSDYIDEYREENEDNDVVDILNDVDVRDSKIGETISEPAIEWEKRGVKPYESKEERLYILKKYIEKFYNFVRSKKGLVAISLHE